MTTHTRNFLHPRLLILLALVASTIGLTGCEQAGGALYDTSMQIERRVFGLDEKTAQVTPELSIHYYEGGPADAETLVLVHGYSADRNNWPRFARHLIKDYHIIVPDLPGHGLSTWNPDWTYSIPNQTRWLHDFLASVGVEKFHLVGNSMGGFISATYALTYPDELLSVALFDAAGVPMPNLSPMYQQIAQGQNPFLLESPEQFLNFLDLAMEDRPWAPTFVYKAVGARYVALRDQLAKIHKDFHERDNIGHRVGEIQTPTLVLWGRQDRLLDVSSAEFYHQGIPGSQLAVMDGVGHLPMMERPAESASIYRDFLESLPQ